MKKTIVIILSLVVLTVATAGVTTAVIRAKENKDSKDYREPDSLTVSEEMTESTTVADYVSNDAQETKESVAEDISGSFDADKIRMLNIFLSNFSEIYINEITNENDAEIIRFVMLNLRANYYDKFSTEYSATIDGTEYNLSISESYMQERAKRFFDREVSNQSVDYIKFYNNRYYFPNADGEKLTDFSKATRISKLEDGSLSVDFTVYRTDNPDGVIYSDSPVYSGFGSDNLSDEKIYCKGVAVLKEKYFGENYANYVLVSLKCEKSGESETVEQSSSAATSRPAESDKEKKDESWKKAYYDFYKSKAYEEQLIGEPEDATFGLKDLNNDGTPELLIADPWEGGTYGHGYVYTCSNGEVKYIGCSDSFGGIWWPHPVSDDRYPGLFTIYWFRGETGENEMPFHLLYYYYDGNELVCVDVASDINESGEYERITDDAELYNSIMNSDMEKEYPLVSYSDIQENGWDSFCAEYGY